MSLTKIFHFRHSKQFSYQTSLLCDGEFTAKLSQKMLYGNYLLHTSLIRTQLIQNST